MEIFNQTQFIISEYPEKDIWDSLRLFLTKDFLDKFSGYHFTKERIESLKFLFNQSYEYYIASKHTNITVSPLLQFYSISLLSKIFILINRIKNGIECLDGSHGLKLITRNPKVIDIQNTKVKIYKKGTFVELLKCFNKSPENISLENYSFDELINRNIHLFSHISNSNELLPIRRCERHKDEEIEYLKIYFIEEINDFPFIDKEKLFRHKEDKSYAARDGYPYRYYYSSEDQFNFDIEKDIFNNYFLIKPICHSNFISLNQIQLLYMISFIASNFVRYYPMLWKMLITSEADFFLIRKSLDLINRCFPNLILNYLIKKYIIMRAPGNIIFSKQFTS